MATKKKTEVVEETGQTDQVEKVEVKKGTKKSNKKNQIIEAPADMTPEMLEKMFKLSTTAMMNDKRFANVFHAFLYETEKLPIKRFSSGSVSLDMALGGDGLPYGRIIEIWGPEGGGKTSLGLEIAWNLQRATGKAVVFIDVEHKFDKTLLQRWKGVGFLPNMTFCLEPFTGEEAFQLVEHYVQNPATGIVIMDSISGVRSNAVLEEDDQETHYGKQAKLISDYLPKISGLASRTGVPMLFMNQVRANLEANKFAKGRFKLTKTGGKAYAHYISISMFMDKIGGKGGILSDGVHNYGHWANVWVYKNHSGPTPFDNFKLCLHYGYGFDNIAELVDISSKLGLIETSGSWLSVGEVKAHGRDNFIHEVRQNPSLERYLWDTIKSNQTAAATLNPSKELDVENAEFLMDEGIEIQLPGYEEDDE